MISTLLDRFGGWPDPSSFRPTHIVEVDLDEDIPAMTASGPARVLVRRSGRPVAFVPVTVPDEGLTPEEVRKALDEAIASEGYPAEPAHAEAQAVAPVRATVVITTCVATRGLLRVLDDVRAQTITPHEIVVVDNRPNTSGVTDLFQQQGIDDVRLVLEHRPGLSRARNAGLAASTGDVIAFLDDDIAVDSRWLEAITEVFRQDPSVACVTGMILPMELETPAQYLFEEFGGFSKGFHQRRYDLKDHRGTSKLYPYAAGVFGTGANGSFRVDALRALNGFDEKLGMGTPAKGGEDLDIYLSVIQSGRTLVYEPAALVWHQHHREIAALRHQIFNYGVGMSAMIAKRWWANRQERPEMLQRLGAGVKHVLGPGSPKHQTKTSSYPRALTLIELGGVIRGPFAYWRSRRHRVS
ncbi:GT2 family glycosyltransferase [Actinoplanes tereljensis]|uniref:Glycosyltransferase 2-like domain-containing protein n=1 Tax=Paractinoplanes tereljensis TaxID=571912 RepID=A0A919TY23_9ACTN|nr:glycosyltransferase family 2 protein [Actinoplanes tereljensis]GIF26991.1 hypothetical protein Ate02nite_97210 [Actinoplanes tereljensis]